MQDHEVHIIAIRCLDTYRDIRLTRLTAFNLNDVRNITGRPTLQIADAPFLVVPLPVVDDPGRPRPPVSPPSQPQPARLAVLMYTMDPNVGNCPPCNASKVKLTAAGIQFSQTYAAPPGGVGYPYFRITNLSTGAVSTISGGLYDSEVAIIQSGQLPPSR